MPALRAQACPQGPGLLASCLVKPFPTEAAPYILGTGLMAVLFLAAMIRLWLLRRVEAKLLKNQDALEKKVLTQQKDLMQARSDANAWRSEMQRQFDHFRAMASSQLQVEETRFDNLLKTSREHERELQTTLDLTRQMCAELPSAKARVMQLESLLGIDAGEGLTATPSAPASPPAAASSLSPMPDLNEAASAENPAETDEAAPLPEPTPQAPAEVLIDTITEVPHQELEELRQQNIMLQQALTAERLRARVRERQNGSTKGKHRRN